MGLAILPVSTTVDLDRAKAHLNFDDDDTEDDVELQAMLDAATEWVATQVSDLTPAPVRLAIMELLRHFWDSQRGPAGGPLDEDTGETFSLGLLGFSIPNRVKELLAPYVTGRSIPAPASSFPDALDWPDPVVW